MDHDSSDGPSCPSNARLSLQDPGLSDPEGKQTPLSHAFFPASGWPKASRLRDGCLREPLGPPGAPAPAPRATKITPHKYPKESSRRSYCPAPRA
eukprot:4031020-Pyramimonas_sp.AAC.1